MAAALLDGGCYTWWRLRLFHLMGMDMANMFLMSALHSTGLCNFAGILQDDICSMASSRGLLRLMEMLQDGMFSMASALPNEVAILNGDVTGQHSLCGHNCV